MKTSSAKAKGRKLQQYAARRVTEEFDLEEGDAVSIGMGQPGTDIMLSPAARKKFPFSIECKSTKSVPGKPALEQSKYNCYEKTLPIVVWKPFRSSEEEAIVMVKFEDFIAWWKGLNHEEPV